jgi:hypothetical protein
VLLFPLFLILLARASGSQRRSELGCLFPRSRFASLLLCGQRSNVFSQGKNCRRGDRCGCQRVACPFAKGHHALQRSTIAVSSSSLHLTDSKWSSPMTSCFNCFQTALDDKTASSHRSDAKRSPLDAVEWLCPPLFLSRSLVKLFGEIALRTSSCALFLDFSHDCFVTRDGLREQCLQRGSTP